MSRLLQNILSFKKSLILPIASKDVLTFQKSLYKKTKMSRFQKRNLNYYIVSCFWSTLVADWLL